MMINLEEVNKMEDKIEKKIRYYLDKLERWELYSCDDELVRYLIAIRCEGFRGDDIRNLSNNLHYGPHKEWWQVSLMLGERLIGNKACVIKNRFGYWWLRDVSETHAGGWDNCFYLVALGMAVKEFNDGGDKEDKDEG